MFKMCNRAVSRAVQGEGEEKRVSTGEKKHCQAAGEMDSSHVLHPSVPPEKAEREAMKDGQRVGQRCGTKAGSSFWLKHSQ